MLYRSADQLESGPYARKSGDLAWQLFLSAGAIIAASYPVNTMVFLRPFMLCIIYLSSALAPPGSQTSFFGMITFPVKYYPYVMLGLDLLTGGPGAAAQSLPGAVVGHLWWWGVWQTRALEELGKAPKWLAAWFGDRSGSLGEGSSGSTGTGVHVVPPRSRAQPAAGGSGSFRGAGHRLGSG
ncbi:hypothetical protein VNI00_010540 [Paramarasmius palmivorus]|uniref:Derlin n=1 Tax=Paramarasmius palmivorus TaxID=297713 RepID=A0AAW0CLC8_9AGAR